MFDSAGFEMASDLQAYPAPKISKKKAPSRWPGFDDVVFSTDATGVKRSARVSSDDFASSEFPRFFTETTPGELVGYLEEKTGTRLYYDEKAGSLTDRKPPGFLERPEAWWRTHRVRWMP